MEGWTIGLLAVLIVGALLVGYGALSDRAKNRRAATTMLAPPERSIPAFDPASPPPRYLSELQARRPPTEAASTELSAEQRQQLERQIAEPTTNRLDAALISRDFVTDAHTGWAVLTEPRVLVCAEPVEALRELMPALEAVKAAGAPLVVAAPFLAAEVATTLEVNTIQQTLRVVGVTASAAVLRQTAEATGTEPVTRVDLQSGYLSLDRLGRCGCWVSDNRRSYVLDPPTTRGPA